MSGAFDTVYARLRAVMLDAAPGMTVTKDALGALELRTAAVDPKTGALGWFGTVTVKKSYVAAHLMPLYLQPDLANDLSPALAARRQGKTCFNFKRVDEELFAELGALMRRCAAAA